MVSARVMLAITEGNQSVERWLEALDQEQAVTGRRAKPCDACPLQEGGPWREHAGALKGLEVFRSWGCHLPGNLACAGMMEVIGCP